MPQTTNFPQQQISTVTRNQPSSLCERVITISGDNISQLFNAVEAVLEKIQEDPQSASCPNLSYANISGLVANANPTGSPFAPVNQNHVISAVNGLNFATNSLETAILTSAVANGQSPYFQIL